MKKKSLVILFCLITAISLSGCGNSSNTAAAKKIAPTKENPVVIKVDNNATSGGVWETGLKKFKEIAEQKTAGKVKIEIYSNGQLSNRDMRTCIEMVQSGAIQMGLLIPAIYEQFDARWQIFSMPYLFDSREKAWAACDGEPGKYMLSLLPDKQIQGLGLWEQGFRNLTTSKKEVHVPADLKGMTIRVMDSPSFISMFKNMGVNPVVTSFGELYTAMQQGAVDGQENPLTTIGRNKLCEVQDYLVLSEHVYNPLIVGMNKAFYDSLPEDIQKALTEAVTEAAKTERDENVKEDKMWEVELAKQVKVIKLTDQEKKIWAESTKHVYDESKDKIGDQILTLFNKK